MRQTEAPVSFVVRVWLEPALEGISVWRGHIQHVQSGQETYFQDARRLMGFLETVAGVCFPLDATANGHASHGAPGRDEAHHAAEEQGGNS